MEEKLKNVFEAEYSESKLSDFLIKTQKAYEFFGYDFKLLPIEMIPGDSFGAKIWLNEDYANSLISNLEIINFRMIYPNLISKIARTNLENFNEVYSKLIDLYYTDGNIELKKYINMTYGCLRNPKSSIFSNNIHLVSSEANKMMNDILYQFWKHIVYLDTDQIVFRNFDEIRERFEGYFKTINKYELDYFSEKSKFGLFLRKKQYILEEAGWIKIRGIKHFTKDGIFRGGYISIK